METKTNNLKSRILDESEIENVDGGLLLDSEFVPVNLSAVGKNKRGGNEDFLGIPTSKRPTE